MQWVLSNIFTRWELSSRTESFCHQSVHKARRATLSTFRDIYRKQSHIITEQTVGDTLGYMIQGCSLIKKSTGNYIACNEILIPLDVNLNHSQFVKKCQSKLLASNNVISNLV